MAKVLVTPKMATAWLNNNEHNRKKSTANVNKIATAMTNGKWAYNGEPIIIADSGELLDGQHRLLAIEKAGVDVWMEVVIDVPSVCEYTKINVFATIDTGKSRSSADVISIANNKVRATLATKVVKIITSVDTRTIKNLPNQRPTNTEVLNSFLEHEDLIQELIEEGVEREEQNIYHYMKAEDFAMLRYSLRGEKDQAKVEEFIEMLTNFTPEHLEDDELCNEGNEVLCKQVKTFYNKMSNAVEIMGITAPFRTLKNIGMFKTYHYYVTGNNAGMGISKTMDIIYPDSLKV